MKLQIPLLHKLRVAKLRRSSRFSTLAFTAIIVARAMQCFLAIAAFCKASLLIARTPRGRKSADDFLRGPLRWPKANWIHFVLSNTTRRLYARRSFLQDEGTCTSTVRRYLLKLLLRHAIVAFSWMHRSCLIEWIPLHLEIKLSGCSLSFFKIQIKVKPSLTTLE